MYQLNIFDLTLPKFQIEKPIRLIELFAGVGSQAMALRDLGADFQHYKISEWEVSANNSYKAIHNRNDETDYSKEIEKFKWITRILYEKGISVNGKKRMTLKEIRNRGEKWCRQTYNKFRANKNIGNIVNAHALDLRIIDTDKYCYIMTYSFPCQDLSVAGKQAGMKKGSGTRSGLLWEVERLLNECDNLPQVLLMENVPAVHSEKNMPDFQKWIDFLASKVYSNYWQDLNAKDYGVAQNRERCFMVSILGEWNYNFPQPIPLTKPMKDYLEDEVDEKYYINTEKAQKLIDKLIKNRTIDNRTYFVMDNGNFNQRSKVHGEDSICRTIPGSGHARNEPKLLLVGNINPNGKGINGNVYAGDLSPTITTNKGEGAKIFVCIDDTYRYEDEERIYDEICPTLRSGRSGLKVVTNNFRIRKQTPKECWRLMDFSDEDFHKAESVNSNSQLYKQAGNSICRNVLVAIFGQMLKNKNNLYKKLGTCNATIADSKGGYKK